MQGEKTWVEQIWDAIKGIFVKIVWAVIDGIARVLKRLVWDAVYGGWREEWR